MAIGVWLDDVSSMIRGHHSGTHENSMAHGHEILGERYFWFPCARCCSPALEEPILCLCLVEPGWIIAFMRNRSQFGGNDIVYMLLAQAMAEQ